MQGYLMRSILSELEEMRSTNMRRKTLKTVHSTYLKHKIQEKRGMIGDEFSLVKSFYLT